MSVRGWTLGALFGVLAAGGAGLAAWRGILAKGRRCGVELAEADLEASLRLGSGYVLAHQRGAGNFDYEYDWRTKALSTEDNQVRQAGALWGLALLAAAPPALALPPDLVAAAWKGMRFFDAHAAETAAGARYPIYVSEGRSDARGTLGTAALVTLSLVELLRAGGLPDAERPVWERKLGGYLKFLVAARNADGLWHGEYDLHTGQAMGEHSSYSDGEALLALTKAAKYLGHKDLEATVLEAAAAGHALNVVAALAQDPDSDVTKGYYQWSSMAFYELATSDWRDKAAFGDWVLGLSDWMTDVHKTLERPRNTGYAYEGLVPAFALARERGDAARTAKLGCVIHTGLAKLMSWQIGHPRAAALGPSADRLAVGGVQNGATEPGLRIDVVQHQMHGTLMAWAELFGPGAASRSPTTQ